MINVMNKKKKIQAEEEISIYGKNYSQEIYVKNKDRGVRRKKVRGREKKLI
jgi:hypothetical protein